MIEGLKVYVRGSQLSEMLKRMSNAALSECEIAERQLEMFKAISDASDQPLPGFDSASVKRLAKRANDLQWAADHVAVMDDYLLGLDDLKALGINLTP